MISVINVKPKIQSFPEKKHFPTEGVGLMFTISSLARHTLNTLKEFVKIPHGKKVVNGLLISKFATVPLSLLSIKSSVPSLCSKTARVDAALNITGEVGSTLDAMTLGAEGLMSVGALTTQAAKVLTPIGYISTILELASLVLTIKHCVETYIFGKTLHKIANLDKKPEEYSLEDFRKGLDYIEERCVKEKGFIDKHLDTDELKLVDQLVKIEQTARDRIREGNESKVIESKREMHSTMIKLKKRIYAKEMSHILSGIAAVVALIGVVILIVGVTAYVGFALLGVSAGIVIGRFIYNKVKTARFEREMHIVEKKR